METSETVKTKDIISSEKLIISANEARKILGNNYKNITDKELSIITKSLQNFAKIFLDTQKTRPP
jgi:hypothetical protein